MTATALLAVGYALVFICALLLFSIGFGKLFEVDFPLEEGFWSAAENHLATATPHPNLSVFRLSKSIISLYAYPPKSGVTSS